MNDPGARLSRAVFNPTYALRQDSAAHLLLIAGRMTKWS
jgi:hypothetical protein